jgi:hypothetical protein
VPFDVIGDHMQDHVRSHNLSETPRRLLVGGMKARQILIATPLLRWYLNHGMVVTKIYQVVEYQARACFRDFMEEVSDARREGDVSTDKAIIADTMKLIGNSGYGSLIMDKTKHRSIKYVQGENDVCLLVNRPEFRKLDCIEPEEQYYELEMAKRKIKLDLPIQLGYIILQYAKLRMLQFYYDFMDAYVDRSNFEYLEMDTDSAYYAISGKALDDVIKPEMRQKYDHGLRGFCHLESVKADAVSHWFPRTCCQKHGTYDMRTPGLFKLEYEGDEMIGLCSKTYIVKNGSEVKFSSKGISKRFVSGAMDTYRQVLQSGKSASSTNRGFRVKDNEIYTYAQQRCGFTYFYCKRKVLGDGIHTVPLELTLCPIPPNKEQEGDASDYEARDDDASTRDGDASARDVDASARDDDASAREVSGIERETDMESVECEEAMEIEESEGNGWPSESESEDDVEVSEWYRVVVDINANQSI